MKMALLAYWLHAFFHEWLAEQRNCSRHTILSYRDTWRLYLRFVAAQRHRPVSSTGLDELTADEVVAFLKHIESERHTSIGTRNRRLAALHSLPVRCGPGAVSGHAMCCRIAHSCQERANYRKPRTSTSRRSR